MPKFQENWFMELGERVNPSFNPSMLPIEHKLSVQVRATLRPAYLCTTSMRFRSPLTRERAESRPIERFLQAVWECNVGMVSSKCANLEWPDKGLRLVGSRPLQGGGCAGHDNITTTLQSLSYRLADALRRLEVATPENLHTAHTNRRTRQHHY